MDEVDHPAESGKPRLRPRWGVWLRCAAWCAVPAVALAVYAAVWGRVLPLVVLGYPLAYLIGQIIAIGREYRMRPPVLRYWTDRSEFLLTVREQRSGKVLLRSALPSLAGQDLSDCPLQGANLQGLDLQQLDLSGRDLSGANLSGARLNAARLVGANLRGANLEGAVLNAADLTGADLRHARLARATLMTTDLREADLRGADFVGRGAGRVVWIGDLGGPRLQGARCDATTRWPPGFDHLAQACIQAPDLVGHLPIPAESEVGDPATLPVPYQPLEQTLQCSNSLSASSEPTVKVTL